MQGSVAQEARRSPVGTDVAFREYRAPGTPLLGIDMKTPLIVTHPSTLIHDGLRRIFAKSQFGPLFIAAKLNEELESQMRSFDSCIWLVGASRYDSTIDDLLRRVTRDAQGVKPVIFTADHAPDDMVTALKAGAFGFLRQDISPEPLLKSLELVACGQVVVHRDCHLGQIAASIPANGEAKEHGAGQRKGIDSYPLIAARTSSEISQSDVTQSLSRRELLILRMLIEGASNKGIALKLVITESTVKVHMKAILRKLRLQNRTQVAMWARNHIDENVWIGLSSPADYTGRGRRDGTNSLPALAS
jgi:two-component system, NarL family, nitrate/nitrite response regulator NarL